MSKQLPPQIVDALRAQHGVIIRPQLRALGCSDRTTATLVHHAQLIRIHAGAYADADVWRNASARMRHCLRLLAVQFSAPDAIACGTTAAIAWGLPVRTIPERPVVIRERHSPRLVGATVRRKAGRPGTISQHADLTLTTTTRTVVDIAAESDLADALITIDAALRRGMPLQQLLDDFASRSGLPGQRRALHALNAGNPAAESPLESLSRGRMIQRRMPIPLCNVVIECEGRHARVDHFWPELGIVGECDGKLKYESPNDVGEVIWKEKRRHAWLEDLGFEVVRWGYTEVADSGVLMDARYFRAVVRQRRIGFEWPADVTVTVPDLSQISANGGLPALWTPSAA